MKIFAIRDDYIGDDTDVAYLFYYENDRRFYIEVPDNADPADTPLILSSFVTRGVHTINSYWSMKWVENRIVPTDRQNIGHILRDNGLKEYDEFKLLDIACGRCAQDDCYIVPITESDLPESILRRSDMHIDDIITLPDYDMLVFFRDCTVRKINVRKFFESDRSFAPLLRNESLFHTARIQTDGHGVEWDVNMSLPCKLLYGSGEQLPVSADVFKTYAAECTLATNEACGMLGCTRQNIEYLAKTDRLHPVKASGNNKLYLKSEILKRKWV